MHGAINWVAHGLGIAPETGWKLFTTVVLFLVLWGVRRLSLWFVAKRTTAPEARYRWRKVATYIIFILGIILIGRVWLDGIQSIVTYLGLVSAGLAIALRDPIVNLFGRIFITWQRPFVVGNRIAIADIAGDVIDIGMSTFSLLEVGGWIQGDQSSGRIVHIPNGKVFSEPLVNYSQGFDYIWNEIAVTVTYESNWEKAKAILEEIVQREAAEVAREAQQWIRHASRRFLILDQGSSPAVYTRIVEDGVLLIVRYLCKPRKRRVTEQAISEEILRMFSEEPSVDFAYRTTRIYRQTEEEKPSFRHSAELDQKQ